MIEHSRPELCTQDREILLRAFDQGWIGEGPWAERLVRELSQTILCPGGITVGSATDGLVLALLALGVHPSDPVLIPTLVCRDVLDAVLRVGAEPVLCDARPADFNMDLSGDLSGRLRARAAILVHMFGCPCCPDPLREAGIPVIEDCAHAAGASLDGRRVGGLGDLAVFSLSAIKSLPGGEGGVVIARTPEAVDTLQRTKQGREKDASVRMRSRTSDLTAALALSQLKRLPDSLKRRQVLADHFKERLSHLPVSFLEPVEQGSSSWHRFIVKLDAVKPDFSLGSLLEAFWAREVRARLPVTPGPLHRILGLPAASFPKAEELSQRSISLPFYPALTDREVDKVLTVTDRLLSKM